MSTRIELADCPFLVGMPGSVVSMAAVSYVVAVCFLYVVNTVQWLFDVVLTPFFTVGMLLCCCNPVPQHLHNQSPSDDVTSNVS